MRIPTDAQFYSDEDPMKPDIAFLKNHFYREGRLSEEQALYILHTGTAVLHEEPNLLDVDAPITGPLHQIRSLSCLLLTDRSRSAVCGDIHGQYVNIASIFGARTADDPTFRANQFSLT
jgi:serine/threonine-protein phosphatase 2B catalytic subunit